MRRVLAICLVLPLASCGLFVSKETRAMRRTPEYRAGYNDGCSSAGSRDANMRDAAPQQRDDDMYASNKAYRTGWGAGYGACRTYEPQNIPSPDRGPIPDVNPGNGGIP